MTGPWSVEAFFDGACPLCLREVNLLRRLDRRGRLRWVDIAAPDFDAAAHGKTQEELMGRMHARLPDGAWVEGVEVFRRLYAAVGFAPLVALSRLPGVSAALDTGYALFARNRLRWTGRGQECSTDRCAVRPKTATFAEAPG
ncbi:MAG: thiol-disulfide oxidoreductase DCC family protein [Planctomycetota bacterium]